MVSFKQWEQLMRKTGDTYTLIEKATHTETQEELIIYWEIKTENVKVQPLNTIPEEVKFKGVPSEWLKRGRELRHYKGGKYSVLAYGTHAETHEAVAIYRAEIDRKLWVRPLKMFTEFVEYNGETVMRFTEM